MDTTAQKGLPAQTAPAHQGGHRAWQLALPTVLLSLLATALGAACSRPADFAIPFLGCTSSVLLAGALSLLSLLLAAWVVHVQWQKPMQQVARALAHMSSDAPGLPATGQPPGAAPAQEALQWITVVQTDRDALLQAVDSSSRGIDELGRQLASRQALLAESIENQANSLQNAVNSIDAVVHTSADSDNAAKMADEAANEAAMNAVNGSEAVVEAVTAMHGIQESSRRISEITSLVDGIAFQTNILALNAAVEAARAGDQGRGFAVVAGEVRTLATRSASAAREIKALIATSSERVAAGSAHFDRAGKSMELVMENLGNVISHLAEIKKTSQSQFEMVHQINTEVAQAETGAQKRTALLQQLAGPIGDIQHEASRLQECTRRFHV